MKQQLKALLAQPAEPIRFAAERPTVIIVAGVNGAAKRPRLPSSPDVYLAKEKGGARRGRHLSGRGRRAVDHLGRATGRRNRRGELGQRSGQRGTSGRGPGDRNQCRVCIIDTAGRLQTQQNLMQELAKIRRVIGKQIPEAPHEVLLVLDATTGQNGISQANISPPRCDAPGIILAKVDGTAKGGVVVAIRQQVGLPVKYIGDGRKGRRFGPVRRRFVRRRHVRGAGFESSPSGLSDLRLQHLGAAFPPLVAMSFLG